MPAISSEIDEIFASKGKAKITLTPASSDPPVKKIKKKRKRDVPAISNRTESDPSDAGKKSRPALETVVDPSAREPPAKKAKNERGSGSSKPAKVTLSKKKSESAEQERFNDSRGSGPRRKTEEGYLIYTEEELGIGGEGGDTPLCPFDCQCCV